MNNTNDCLLPTALKKYLAGLTNEEDTGRIEDHLSHCPTCEQTIVDLEGNADTMIQCLQLARESAPKTLTGVSDAGNSDEIAKAFERAKQLMIAPDLPKREPWVPPSSDIGTYELIKPLGRGGMATVYMARHRQLGKIVAIKLLPSTTDESDDAAARFQREIRAAGRLNHPSIVAATDAGQHEGSHYLVMEYVDGMDLSRLARLLGPLPIPEASEIVRQIALGLAHAHAEGIVHRDIKPSNLMLDTDSHAKILDFGLAQLNLWDEASAELTTVGQLMGTLDYMAPEQAERSSSVDYRADLYSLGATMFRLLCGRAPLAATPNLSPLEKLKLIASHEPLRLNTLRPDAPPELVQIVAALLSRSPDARPASAAHVAEQLAPLAQSSDLISLIRQAQSAAVKSPESIVRRTAAMNQLAGPDRKVANDSGRHRFRRWLVAAALLPIAILGGYLILLETQKGQLIIESDLPDIQVTIVRNNNKVSREMTLTQGANVTKLVAGEYEVTLNKPSDSVSLDDGKLTIRSGDATIAHVRQSSSKSIKPELQIAGENQVVEYSDQVYGGKPLSSWLEQLKWDRSPRSMGDAVVAIRALVNPSTSQKITESLVAILPGLDGMTSIPIGTDSEGKTQTSTVDDQVFGILRAANPGKEYCEVLIKLADDGNVELQRRIIKQGTSPIGIISDFEPWIDWLAKNVFQRSSMKPGNEDLVDDAINKVMGLMSDRDRIASHAGNPTANNAIIKNWKAIALKVFNMLASSKVVDDTFWLKQFQNETQIDEFRHEVIKRAYRALIAEDTSPKFVIQSAGILNSDFALKETLNEQEVIQIQDTIKKRLNTLVKDKSQLLELTNVDIYGAPNTDTLGYVRLQGSASLRAVNWRFDISNEGIVASKLMELALKLNYQSLATEGVSIVELTEQEYQRSVKSLSLVPLSSSTSLGPISLPWPTRSYSSNRGGIRGLFVDLLQQRIKVEDWIGFVLHIQAAEFAGIELAPIEARELGRRGGGGGAARGERAGSGGFPGGRGGGSARGSGDGSLRGGRGSGSDSETFP